MATDPAESPSDRGSKYRFLVSPKWIAFHLLVASWSCRWSTCAFWQLRRLDERRDFNAEVRANANQPIAAYDDVVTDSTDPSTVEWRRVRVDRDVPPGPSVPRRQPFAERCDGTQRGRTPASWTMAHC
jgi:hypothetical protein